VDDYVSLSTITLSAEFSISAWIKPTVLGSNTSTIINTGTNNSNRIGIYNATNLQFKLGGSNVFLTESGGNNFVTNVWQHVLIVRDSSNNISAWRNGAAFGSSVSNSNTATLDSIFRFNNSVYSSGHLDEFAIWNSDQSANVATIYNGGIPNDISSLSPINWWRCGDGDTAPTLIDHGSGGNNGTMTNFSTFSTDVPIELFSRKSILLDGVDDLVTMGNVLETSDTGTSAFSVSCWYKTTNSGTQMFVAKQTNGSPFNGFSLSMQPNNKLSFFLGSITGNKYLYTQTTNLSTHSDGNWHHLVVTYDGSRSTSGMTMYFNGVVKSLTSVRNVAPEGIQNSKDFMIGARGTATSSGGRFTGNIDEVAYFTSELSASDVTSIYNGGVPNDISSLSPLSWWRCGDGDTAPTLTDNGSGGNNGTMTNFSTFSTDVPT
jgi:hypothetical protein